jgi:peptidoglycan/LPS O-acetylase OafA/YrhL
MQIAPTVVATAERRSPSLDAARALAAPDALSRYTLVDGLRGLAACAVMLYHFGSHALSEPLSRVVPHSVMALAHRGWLGVHVFFVLSGFVIAHSVLSRTMTARSALYFTLRRQLRLDPPYWLAIGVYAIGAWIDRGTPPEARVVAAHAVYAWDLLGMQAITPVFWSLAIEVQLYLGFVALLAALRRAPSALPWAMGLALAASLACAMTWRYPRAWGTQYAYLFVLGVLVRWALARRVHAAWLGAAALGLVCAGLWFDRSEPLVGAATAAILYVAGRRDALGRWLAARPLQRLGAASYGIYLFHTAGGGIARVALAPLVDATTPHGALIVLAAGVTASVAIGIAVQETVEAFAIGLARRVRVE